MAPEETTAPALPLEMPRRARKKAQRDGLRARWQETWHHALAAYYRGRVGWLPMPRLEAVTLVVVWGLFLGGTALGVHVYADPSVTRCWVRCHDPYWAADLELQAFSLLALYGLLIMLAEALGALLRWTYRRRRKRKLITFLLSNGWTNGQIAMLVITPLGPEGLVRVCFLTHLYQYWQMRGPFLMTLGELGAVVVSLGVASPVFWWLSPWQQWGLMLALVLLWSLVWAAGLVMQAAVLTLHEVDWGSTGKRHGPITATLNLISGLVFPGIVVLVRLAVGATGLPVYEANTWTAALAPLVLAAAFVLLAAAGYQTAQALFRVRLRRSPVPG